MIGDHNRLYCVAPLPKSRGRVSLDIHTVVTAFFEGPSKRLPKPPNYPIDAAQGHCDDWSKWLTETPKIYLFGPSIGLTLESGVQDVVAVTRVDVEIYSRRKAPTGTVIKCLYGGGSNLGYNVSVDTLRQRTSFQAFDDDKQGFMPPASISLGGAGASGASISISSPPGYLYEGSVKVTTLINNKKDVIPIGTPQRPFRWHSGPEPDVGGTYDWHPTKKRWVRDFDPFSL